MILLLVQPSTSRSNKAVMTSPKRIYNSPEKCRLRKRIVSLKQHYKNKMRNFQQNLRRKSDQITTLKCLLNELKQKIY